MIQDTSIFRKGFHDYARKWAKEGNKEASISLLLPSFSSFRSIWLMVYRHTKIPRIEELETEQKANLWEETKELTQGKDLSIDNMKDIVRCLYTMEHYLNESE